MKFAISAVVMLALTLGVQSSVLPLSWSGHPWGAVHAPAAISLHQGPAWGHGWGHPAAISLSHGPAWAPHATAWGHAAWGAPHHGAWAAPHHDAWAAPHHAAIAVHAAPHHHAHEGTYVAKTRGAIHTAPLAGHINSASSINLEPAPGTL